MLSHLSSRAERLQLGAAWRKQMPRRLHANWHTSLRQHDPIVLLADSMQGRLPDLVRLKYQMMAQSPFGFFRGAVPVMAADLAVLPHSGILTQICGDAHVRNLGAYAAPDGRLVFDINDFDETLRAPFEWDLKRLAASLVLAGRESGTKERACRNAVHAFCASYAELMGCLSQLAVVDMARFQVHRLGRFAPVAAVLLKAERSTPQRSLATLTRPATPADVLLQGPLPPPLPRVFKQIAASDGPARLRRASPQEAGSVLDSLALYRETLLPERRHFLDQYQPIDVGFKIVGTGSIGLRDYVIYLQGNGPQDPLFLQVKEEARSGWAPYIESLATPEHAPSSQAAHRPPTPPAHQGQRAAEGQRAMQLQSDPFLGWTTIPDAEQADRPYLVRQLNDHKASIEVEDLQGAGLIEYAQVCGELLARGHARSGDPALLRGYVGKGRSLGTALAAFATRYADQTERDWKTLVHSQMDPPARRPD